MSNKQTESWTVGNYQINILPENAFQRTLKSQRQLQQTLEMLPIPTDPNVELVKKIHNQLPITNWAWKRNKQYEYEKEVNKENQHSTQQQQEINYPTHPKQPDNSLEP